MSIYSSVASAAESAAKANGYNIDLGAKSAKSAASQSAARSSASMAANRGYGSIDDGPHGEDDGTRSGGTREEMGGASDGWGRGWGDEEEEEDDRDRQGGGVGSSTMAATPARRPSWEAVSAPPTQQKGAARTVGFAGFDEGEDDGEIA